MALAIDPKARFLYTGVPSDGTSAPGEICAYTINATTGTLTPVSGSPFAIPEGAPLFGLTIDGTSKHLYGSTGYGGFIFGYTINQTSGALKSVSGSPFFTAKQPEWIAATPNGKFVYVADNTDDDVMSWSINGTTGALTQTGDVPIGGYDPGPITVSATSTFLYLNILASFPNTQKTSAFSINPTTGVLKSLSGSPFPVPGYSLAINSTETFAYSIDLATIKLATLRDNPTTGVLKLQSERSNPVLSSPTWLSLNPSSTYLYLTDANEGIFAFQVNNTTGGLTLLQHIASPAGFNPLVIVVAP